MLVMAPICGCLHEHEDRLRAGKKTYLEGSDQGESSCLQLRMLGYRVWIAIDDFLNHLPDQEA